MYDSVKVDIVGVAPLLVHNGLLADPLNEWAKAIKVISGKRKKTDDDYAEMGRLEWYGGLYLNEQRQPVIPGENIEAMLTKGAKKSKAGQQAKSGIIVDDMPVIIHDGPKDLDKLWQHAGFRKRGPVRVGMARVIRTRPMFRKWQLSFTVSYNPEVLNQRDLEEWLTVAGQLVGLGDWTPKHGRYVVESVQKMKVAA